MAITHSKLFGLPYLVFKFNTMIQSNESPIGPHEKCDWWKLMAIVTIFIYLQSWNFVSLRVLELLFYYIHNITVVAVTPIGSPCCFTKARHTKSPDPAKVEIHSKVWEWHTAPVRQENAPAKHLDILYFAGPAVSSAQQVAGHCNKWRKHTSRRNSRTCPCSTLQSWFNPQRWWFFCTLFCRSVQVVYLVYNCKLNKVFNSTRTYLLVPLSISCG